MDLSDGERGADIPGEEGYFVKVVVRVSPFIPFKIHHGCQFSAAEHHIGGMKIAMQIDEFCE
jgi:hypothetical protein